MPKSKLIYDWVTLNHATQLQAAAHFGVNQGYISRALRSWAKRMQLTVTDNRRKGAP
jgi:transposase